MACCCAALVLLPPAAKAAGVEMAPSVMVVGEYDWVPYQSIPPYTSRCTDMVNRAAAARSTIVNFYPTHYWRGDAATVKSFCYMDTNNNCVDFKPSSVSSFRSGMELCFRRAVELGLGISLVPHLDDGGSSGAWRNGVLFSPNTQYNGMSYTQVMLEPLASALAAALADARVPLQVWFALQGEMSATVLRFPGEYQALVGTMRDRVLGKKDGVTHPVSHPVAVGVSFNFNKVTEVNEAGGGSGGGGGGGGGFLPRLFGRGLRGVGQGTGEDDAGARRLLQQAGSNIRSGVDVTALSSLFETVDFVGISAYASLPPDFKEEELQNSAFTFFNELRDHLGLDAWSIMSRRRIPLHYSEFGIGGGSSGSGSRQARSPAVAAAAPFYGVAAQYRSVLDPWDSKEMNDFRISFYQRALDWLDNGGGPTYPITHCFMWAMGSWDVLGIYPESTTTQGSYRDPAVVAMVQDHNSKVASGGISPAK